jgi:purine nucleosidase
MQNLIIDTDAGVDDAIAIMMALVHPHTQIAAITTVNGNVDVDKVTVNTALILDQYDADIPIYRGCDRPIIAEAMNSAEVHGSDGLGDSVAELPPTNRTPESEHAALALIRLAQEHAGNLTLLALGPLTNIALAIRLDPSFPEYVSRLVVMGGAIDARGNVTPAAEFNIYTDAEAAGIVFDAGFRDLSLLSWETTMAYPMLWSEFEDISGVKSERGKFYNRITAQIAGLMKDGFGAPGFLLPDPLAAGVALQPDLVEDAPHVSVRVEISGEHGRGLTSVDWNQQFGRSPNAFVVRKLDSQQVFDMIRAAVE